MQLSNSVHQMQMNTLILVSLIKALICVHDFYKHDSWSTSELLAATIPDNTKADKLARAISQVKDNKPKII
jgi:hypothetical protein